MCGFVGFSDPRAAPETSRATAERMLSAIAHRGPDGSGWCHHRGVTFAHCALAFVDPEGGRQPFTSRGGATAVVFNGEIYNHAELRHALLADGAVLRTTSDTEVLVELYEREGVRALDRLRGMYAFALHDARTDTTLLVRDPLGKKPLYYTSTPDGIAFASELAALLRHPDCPRAPDVTATADYLVLQAFPAPGSAVTGVHKVRPGSYLRFRRGRREEVEYWRPELRPAHGRVPAREARERFEELFTAAVARRTASTPRRLGVLLSGGLDSSAVAAVAQRLSDGPVPTFSAGFDNPAFDESGHAEAVARHLGTEHHAIRIGQRDLAEVVTSEYAGADEPLADPSLLPTRLICREARRHVRGVLTGDGADELLLGYRFFQAERAMETLLRVIPADRIQALARLARHLPERSGNLPVRAALQQLARGVRAAPEHRFYASTAPFGPGELAGLFSAEARERLTEHEPFREIARLLAGRPALTAMERSQLGIMCHFLRDVILTKADRGGMRSALEIRSPFLDLDLVEFCGTLPTDLKLRRFTSKHLLRRVAADWLPRRTVRQTKLGFRTPLAELLRGALRPVLVESLAPSALAAGGMFDPVAVRGLVDAHLTRRKDNSRRLWALLCYQLWYEGQLASARTTHSGPPVLSKEIRHAV
ncbi:asparagine synthase (glutamine-hydrolyzing) [Streptomyces sp. AK02-01A]|uniref:asparagine synthase (glutamine-hydrolyzing) n=1 Tax=Streptomyces sp. AK02-01A TaxID=3028648 RepID=UPI0029B41F4B|nr:asparagine synthase (glutamine-hydrolyzing) [Streptomyces sp. AK02-01A]MDX3852340.1 asparagine synthase (glutamine-hydrolyzing) [Streptomyces sp. AK02-01A]